MKRAVARIGAIICLLIVAVLALSLFSEKDTHPLRHTFHFLIIIATGCSLYFVASWLRTLRLKDGRSTTVAIGLAWLVVCVTLCSWRFTALRNVSAVVIPAIRRVAWIGFSVWPRLELLSYSIRC
jgi:uncharacterized membrane protein